MFEGEHTYQARSGLIRFTVAGDGKSQPDMHARLCWQNESKPECRDNLPVQWIKEIADPQGVSYAVTIPPGFAAAPDGTPRRLFGLVPLAQLSIFTGEDPAAKSLAVREIGITSRYFAAIMAVLAVLVAGAVLYRFAIYLGVPGPAAPAATSPAELILRAVRGFSVPLRLISTSNGWASLAQFQILLWSFVIGAGAVYVMSLTGSLIAISAGTLALLGIAGGATVLSEVKINQQDAATVALPGAVTNLAPVGGPLETEIIVSWSPPNGSAAPISYLVQYENPAATGVWRTVSRGLRGTSLRIVGLTPDTAYQLRVLASNAAGPGPAATIAAPTVAHAAPLLAPSVTGLQMPAGRTGTSIPLAWTAVAEATYVIEMRLHDSDAAWSAVALPTAENTRVSNLVPNTTYDFRVCTNVAPNAWSAVGTFATGVRTPRWSDIVTDTDRPAAIDVTRVQMLFFTIISAFFVALNIADTGTIPEIDWTYVTLMGISNGVYVTAKFIR